MINIKDFSFNPFQENCYLLWDSSNRGIIVDPGCYDNEELAEFQDYIEKKGITPIAILLTHGHFDHVFGVKYLAGHYAIPVYMSKEDEVIIQNNDKFSKVFGLKAPDVDFETADIEDGDILNFGEMSFEVIRTPGHTPGGVCYYDEADKILLTGDTLFAGSIGRTDNIYGDYDKLIVGIMDKLMGIDGDVDILPGHGPSSNIGYERTHNPFLQPFNEPDDYELDAGNPECFS